MGDAARSARRFWLAALLAGVAALTWTVSRAEADGLVLDIRATGTSGPQMDSASVSPARSYAGATGTSQGVYKVQPGDNLITIAARLNVAPAELAALNQLADPDRLAAGQLLKVPGPILLGPGLTSEGPFDRLQVWPWPPQQGQTLVVWVHAREPVSTSVKFDGVSYAAHSAGRLTWAMIPISPVAQPTAVMLALEMMGASANFRIPVAAGDFPTYSIPASASDPILSEAARVRAETQRMVEVFTPVTSGGWDGRSRFTSPLDGAYPVSSPYGSRRTYGSSQSVSAHAGEDYSAPPGTPVYAPSAGRVVLAEELFVRGQAVVLDVGRGVYTGFWHLSAIDVTVGETVQVGQLLGRVGSTGLSTGAHLHWEVRVAGQPVDPVQWLVP